MADHNDDADDHDAATCPLCQAFSQQAKVIGGMGEALQKLTDDGFFRRLGQAIAEREEQAAINTICGEPEPVIVESK